MQYIKRLIWIATWSSIIKPSLSTFESEHPIKDNADYMKACPNYKVYAQFKHEPYSEGPLKLPFQRPSVHCRTFSSPLVEKVIKEVTERMLDKDLARIFENAFPNTLDTTVRWHIDGSKDKADRKSSGNGGKWRGAQSFIVTGDISAEWLRDSTNQLLQYQPLSKHDSGIYNLILGAINTQVEYVIESPYCNAFQPPSVSNLPTSSNQQKDVVHPAYEPSFVFECKYELDSLAHFLSLVNTFHNNTGSTDFVTPRWIKAMKSVRNVLDQQSESTFDPNDGKFRKNIYTFQRQTEHGTETLSLSGIGNPLNYGTGLIRSAFRASDDASILGFLIPANAQMAIELEKTSKILKLVQEVSLAEEFEKRAQQIKNGIWEHGVVKHKKYGRVFAYEVDGYGSQIMMDDANVPSLLSLPILGFVDITDEVYQNTRKMVLENEGNPYYLTGPDFQGIGGPHVGPRHAWPMSVLIRAMTTDNDDEILECLKIIRNSSPLGLIHEALNVNLKSAFTRPWFAWANSVFAQTILTLAKKKPHLLFGENARPYDIT
ncbi:Meiotically up-regulated gene 157 protein [Golovinomyces cichoracearum]|uniref:Meiotically up-regulated gene 157 protein n=1 Tax=Golovinomyces cichoracearum TaxID=62708 RepID=A0A420J305_9PEZI|nr:Meiotically up-regulated gene 157 protein [Golovinomyces cichoracearum]